jgi:hypothetical protein
MKNTTTLRLLLASLAAAPLIATASDGGRTTFFTGIEVNNEDSQRFDLGITGRTRGGTSIELVGSRTESDSTVLDFSSTYASARVDHDFGRFGFGAGVRHIRDQDLTKTLGFLGSASLNFASGRLTATVETRDTDFDDTAFSTDGALLGLSSGTTASGIASCSVGALGYGLGLNVGGERWSFYASGSLYDYSSYKCATAITSVTGGGSGGSTGGPPGNAPVSVRRPQTVTQLATGTTGRFGGYTSSLIPRESALLESSVMAGTSVSLGSRTSLGVELYRDSEEFAAQETNTALAFVGFRFTPALSAELTLGASDTKGFDTTMFAGLRISATIGN